MRLIDADALINAILTEYGIDPKYCESTDIDGIKAYTDSLILERINEQPTIDAVQVVHGEWIWEDSVCSPRTCSVCKQKFYIGRGWNFCPNCGARMDGKEYSDG